MKKQPGLRDMIETVEQFTICDTGLASYFIQQFGNIRFSELDDYYKIFKKDCLSTVFEMINIPVKNADKITTGKYLDIIDDLKYEQGYTEEFFLRLYKQLFYYFIFYPTIDYNMPKFASNESYYITSNFVRIEFGTFLEILNDIFIRNGAPPLDIEKTRNTILRELKLFRNPCVDIGTVIYTAHEYIDNAFKSYGEHARYNYTDEEIFYEKYLHFAELIAHLIFYAPCLSYNESKPAFRFNL